MKKTGIIAIVAGALLVAGGGTAMAVNAASTPTPVESTQAPDAAATSKPGASSTPSSSAAVDITAAGEVCDPHNLNDVICAAFYPDQVVLNMTLAPRAGDPLASLPDAQRIALAHQACEKLEAGATQDTLNVIDTVKADADNGANNNFTLYSAASLAYCNDKISDDTLRWTLDKYRSMGEQAAKDSFAGGVVIKRP